MTPEPQSARIGRSLPRTWRARLAAWLREKACRLDGGASLTLHGVDEDIWHNTLAFAHQSMATRAFEERHAQLLRPAGMLH